MSADQYRRQLEQKRRQRVEAESTAGKSRTKETEKRSAAAKLRMDAGKTKSETTARSKLREAERREKEAEVAGKDAARWQGKSSGYAKEELSLQTKLTKAERSQSDAESRRRARDEQQEALQLEAGRAELERRIEDAETTVHGAIRELRGPRPEKLRILILGASSDGGLRVGREQKRIRAAVESALHRDLVELDVRPAATGADLLDGVTKFRPHIVHFSGHGDEDLIEFEDEEDAPHQGVIVSAKAFASAVKATDSPPLLVVLNSCNSAAQIDDLVDTVAPFAIGMSDEIDDGDAITYAAQFYAALANGQSVRSSHLSAQAALELAGLAGVDLPTLAWADDVDPAAAVLVQPPP